MWDVDRVVGFEGLGFRGLGKTMKANSLYLEKCQDLTVLLRQCLVTHFIYYSARLNIVIWMLRGGCSGVPTSSRAYPELTKLGSSISSSSEALYLALYLTTTTMNSVICFSLSNVKLVLFLNSF